MGIDTVRLLEVDSDNAAHMSIDSLLERFSAFCEPLGHIVRKGVEDHDDRLRELGILSGHEIRQCDIRPALDHGIDDPGESLFRATFNAGWIGLIRVIRSLVPSVGGVSFSHVYAILFGDTKNPGTIVIGAAIVSKP